MTQAERDRVVALAVQLRHAAKQWERNLDPDYDYFTDVLEVADQMDMLARPITVKRDV